jgi:hypothetical protein
MDMEKICRGNYSQEHNIWTIHYNTEIDKFLYAESIPAQGQPEFVVIMGGIGCGKTTLRKMHYGNKHVVIDAGEIFSNLCDPEVFTFGDILNDAVEDIGYILARQAIAERRNIVSEVVGADNLQVLKEVLGGMKRLGYRVILKAVDCSVEQAIERHKNQDPGNISAYFTESYQLRWIASAIEDKEDRQQEIEL